MGPNPTDRKKEICTALTSVVRKSSLKDSIDPKAFFFLLNSQFNILFTNGTLDLAPLWAALIQQHESDRLYGLFLKFEETGQKLGVNVNVPAQVAALEPERRFVELSSWDDLEAALPPDAASLGLELTPLPDLRPDIKPKVIQGLVQALRASPVGARINASQIQFHLDQHFDELCDGQRFDVRALVADLLSLPDMDEFSLYPGIHKFKAMIEPLGISVTEPEWKIDAATREQALQSATRAANPDDKRASVPVPAPASIPAGLTKTEARLQELGLRSSPLWRRLRIPILVATIVLIGVGGYLSSPTQGLDSAEYPEIPLLMVIMDGGQWIGKLDEPAFMKLPLAQRKEAIKKLTQHLTSEGRFRQAAVIDAKGRIAIWARGKQMDALPRLLK